LSKLELGEISSNMERKLRVNVVCSSRDKRFLVLAEREWTLSSFKNCTEEVFRRLYPHEPKLIISGIQNEFHFDIPLSYKVDEVLVDTGLVFIIEKEVSLLKSLSQTTSAESNSPTNPSDMKSLNDSTQSLPGKKTKPFKKTSRSVKIQTNNSHGTVVSSSSNKVTSTTSPTLTEQGDSLMPQIVEKISEDSDVDVEGVDDSITQSLDGGSNDLHVGIKRKPTGRKASQLLLRKARKLKKKTLNSTEHMLSESWS